MIVLLSGDDRYAIQHTINNYKAEIDSHWFPLLYHRFPSQSLEQAISAARTSPLTGGKKLVIVEDCNLKQWGDEQFHLLQQLDHVPDSTILVFLAVNVDKRLKVYKHLVKYGKPFEFELIPPWRTDLIEQAIATQAQRIKLVLSQSIIEYLGDAIGNDTTRIGSELLKLSVYKDNKPLSLKDVRELVRCQTQSTLELAEAVRQGDSAKALHLLHELLSRSEPLIVIVATLLTQFRTWLWVKSALKADINKDLEIANVCRIANPKRVYYLKQEVAATSVRALAQGVTMLFELDMGIRQGYSGINSIVPVLLRITRSFK